MACFGGVPKDGCGRGRVVLEDRRTGGLEDWRTGGWVSGRTGLGSAAGEAEGLNGGDDCSGCGEVKGGFGEEEVEEVEVEGEVAH